MKKPYGYFFLFCRAIVRLVQRRPHPPRLVGFEQLKPPVVLITRHQHFHGPATIMAWSPLPLRLWILDKLAVYKLCVRHYREYTYPIRGHGPVTSAILAFLLAPPMALLARSSNCIVVHRGHREIMQTLEDSVEALVRGENVCLSPDIQYMDTSSGAVEMYTGFVHLAKQYYKRTGKALSFYPVYTSRRMDQIRVGDPVTYQPGVPFGQEKERIVSELRASFETLSLLCGDTDQDTGKQQKQKAK